MAIDLGKIRCFIPEKQLTSSFSSTKVTLKRHNGNSSLCLLNILNNNLLACFQQLHPRGIDFCLGIFTAD